jgi:hypothetical protein
MLLHFYPFPFINPDEITTLAFYFVSIADAIIPDYPASPAVQHLSLPDL